MMLRALLIGSLCLAAASPALAFDGQVRPPSPANFTSSNAVPVAVQGRDRADHNYGWAEIQALRAFTRMK